MDLYCLDSHQQHRRHATRYYPAPPECSVALAARFWLSLLLVLRIRCALCLALKGATARDAVNGYSATKLARMYEGAGNFYREVKTRQAFALVI